MQSRSISIINKIIGTFIFLGVLSIFLTTGILLTLNQRILTVGGVEWGFSANIPAQITRQLASEALVFLAIILVILIALAFYLSRRWVEPLRTLLQNMEEFRRGEGFTDPEIHTGDEVERMAENFRFVVEELDHFQIQVEQQVSERTKALEQRATQIQAAAEVGRAAASIRDLNELLDKAVHLIADRFGFYHVGIFLLDPSGEYAELRAANSDGGKKMLNAGHQLKVGQVGIVGFAAETGQPRVAYDVGEDSVHFKNEYLPDTRSEMALPLMIGENVLGVLDVQSTEQAAFQDDDIATLRILADQLAVAIENARLFDENQSALSEIQNSLDMTRRAYGQVTREAWKKLLRTRSDYGYHSDETGVTKITEVNMHSKSTDDPRNLALPIRIREQILGTFEAFKPEGEEWIAEEIQLAKTLIEQLSASLESARLYQETQRRAERERLAGEISAKLRESNDPRAIMETAIKELRQALHANRAQVLVHQNNSATPDNSNHHEPDQEGSS